MKRRNAYVMFPGHCMVTGSSDASHDVLDLELDREYDGASYLSGKLVEEAAVLWDFVPPAKFLELVEERDALARKVDELTLAIKAIDELEGAAAAVTAHVERAKRIVAA